MQHVLNLIVQQFGSVIYSKCCQNCSRSPWHINCDKDAAQTLKLLCNVKQEATSSLHSGHRGAREMAGNYFVDCSSTFNGML